MERKQVERKFFKCAWQNMLFINTAFRKRFLFFYFLSLFLTFFIFSQGAINHPLGELQSNEDFTVIQYTGENNYILTERTDLRLYTNGKYTGLESREVSSFIIPRFLNGEKIYEGLFYVNKDTKHNQKIISPGIHDAISSSFKINSAGELFMLEDNGYPTFRSFPSFPSKKIKKGDTWTSKALRAVDPLYKGVITKIPLEISYTYCGDDVFHDESVYLITAKWATRYGMIGSFNYMDWEGDYDLERATGTHSATIYVSKKTGCALVIRDSVDETFFYTDGNYYQFKGTITLFTEYPPTVNKEEIIHLIEEQSKSEELNDILFTKTEAGLCLTIENLRFESDSATLILGEEERLSGIAKVLLKAEKSKFLIEGFTADTHNPVGEKQLSLERAKTVAEKLSAYGIEKERFICRGRGSEKPIASNKTASGKAKNRRVEITILE